MTGLYPCDHPECSDLWKPGLSRVCYAELHLHEQGIDTYECSIDEAWAAIRSVDILMPREPSQTQIGDLPALETRVTDILQRAPNLKRISVNIPDGVKGYARVKTS